MVVQEEFDPYFANHYLLPHKIDNPQEDFIHTPETYELIEQISLTVESQIDNLHRDVLNSEQKIEAKKLLKQLKDQHLLSFVHSINVGVYASTMAETLRMDVDGRKLVSDEEVAIAKQKFWIAGLLHDVGKGDEKLSDILKFKGDFDTQRHMRMREHVEFNRKLLQNFPPYIQDAGIFHHERWNGEGYPEGLHEDLTPFIARVMAICDVFDARTNYRGYDYKGDHRKQTLFEAMKDMCNSQQEFDPAIIHHSVKFYRAMKRALYRQYKQAGYPDGIDTPIILELEKSTEDVDSQSQVHLNQTTALPHYLQATL